MDFHSFASSVTVIWKSVMQIQPTFFNTFLKSDLISKGLHWYLDAMLSTKVTRKRFIISLIAYTVLWKYMNVLFFYTNGQK